MNNYSYNSIDNISTLDNASTDNYNTQSTDVDSSGVDLVQQEIYRISEGTGTSKQTPLKDKLNGPDYAYAIWVKDQTPENMSNVISALAPTINSEILHYSGPKSLLRSKAKVIAVDAVKHFNPMSGAKLSSWVTTNLKQLSRYSIQNRDIKIPEIAAQQAALVNATTEELKSELGRDPTDAELADELGIPEKRIAYVRSKAVASINSSKFDELDDDTPPPSSLGVIQSDIVTFAQEAIYRDLSERDKYIFDAITGLHGKNKQSAAELSKNLGVSPAAISQRAKFIGDQIKYIVNNG